MNRIARSTQFACNSVEFHQCIAIVSNTIISSLWVGLVISAQAKRQQQKHTDLSENERKKAVYIRMLTKQKTVWAKKYSCKNVFRALLLLLLWLVLVLLRQLGWSWVLVVRVLVNEWQINVCSVNSWMKLFSRCRVALSAETNRLHSMTEATHQRLKE